MTEIEFDTVLKKVPLLADIPLHKMRITPLPGLTNLNYHLRHHHNDYVLRVPGKYTNRYIDRDNEAFNTDLAVRLKLAPETLWRDASGLSLTQCVRHSRSLTKNDLFDDEVLDSLVDKLAILHGSNLPFKGQTDIDGLLTVYFNSMPGNKRHQLSENFETALKISRQLAETDKRLVASHNDLVLENILIDRKSRLWLIDWEYSSLSSPYWDIATICNSARLEPQHCQHLLSIYNNTPAHLRLQSLYAYQYILQLLTISWLTAYTGEPVEEEIKWLLQLQRSTNQA